MCTAGITNVKWCDETFPAAAFALTYESFPTTASKQPVLSSPWNSETVFFFLFDGLPPSCWPSWRTGALAWIVVIVPVNCPDGDGRHLSLSSAPVTVRSLQDLSRIYIRRTLRNLASEDTPGKGTVQRVQQKHKHRRCRRRRINTYVFVGNQLIPQMVESEEEEHPEEEQKEVEEEEERDIGDVEILKQVNVLREQIMALPLPESLKAYLLYYREKWLPQSTFSRNGWSACWIAFLHLFQYKCSIISIKSWWQNCNWTRRHR